MTRLIQAGWVVAALLVLIHVIWTNTDPRFSGASASPTGALALRAEPYGLVASRFDHLAGDAR